MVERDGEEKWLAYLSQEDVEGKKEEEQKEDMI